MPSLRFNVQSNQLWLPFWTSSCLPSASTSNPTSPGSLFGLHRAFPPLQRPIQQASAPFLDFIVSYLGFNVQSKQLRLPFWTSSCLPSASTSNPTSLDFLFGLHHAFPPLQRPIQPALASFLDFIVPSLRFNVQSNKPRLSFWTSSCLPSASTSNPTSLGSLSDKNFSKIASIHIDTFSNLL